MLSVDKLKSFCFFSKKKIEEVKTPFYIVDCEVFESNARKLIQAITKRYSNYRLAYSYKTNYEHSILIAAKKLGLYAEVVSPKEYDLARNTIVNENRQIIYNGVIPSFKEKLLACKNGAIVNLESVGEVCEFYKYAVQSNDVLEIGVRLNFEIEGVKTSRFGIDTSSEDFNELLRMCDGTHLKVKCVHCHISNAREIKYFKERIRIMGHYAKIFGASIIDIGGNMASDMHSYFREQFQSQIPTYEEYGEAIGTEMKKLFPDESVTLVTENGTALVTTAMHIVTSIIGIKTIKGRTLITTDARRDEVGSACHSKKPFLMHIGKECNKVSNAMVYGCSCVEIDILHSDYNGYANIGDKLIFTNIGAYSVNNSNDFITNGTRRFIHI